MKLKHVKEVKRKNIWISEKKAKESWLTLLYGEWDNSLASVAFSLNKYFL